MSIQQNLQKFSRLFPELSKIIETVSKKESPPLIETGWAESLTLDKVSDLFIYGVGRGEALKLFESFLQKDKGNVLIFLEPDLEVLKGLMETPEGIAIFSHPQVQIYPIPPDMSLEKIYKRLVVQSTSRGMAMIKDPRSDPEMYKSFVSLFEYNRDVYIWHLREFTILGGSYFVNFYQNLKKLPSCYSGADLFGQFKGVPAFIVGAGPSLQKNGHLLERAKKCGLVFAGSSSITALAHLGIQPSLGVGIDPNQMQRERLKGIRIDYPYLFRMRLNNGALDLVEGPKYYIPGSGGYKMSQWLEKELGLQGSDLSEGYNVVNFMTSLAFEMGCNPIVFVGMDLSLQGNKMHAEGVPKESLPKDLAGSTDIYGEKITTRWIWIKERQWIYEFVASHPEVQFYNATEGGILHLPLVTLEGFLSTLKEIEISIPRNRLDVSYQSLKVTILKLRALIQRLKKILLRMRRSKNPFDPLWEKMLEENEAFSPVLSELVAYVNDAVDNTHVNYFFDPRCQASTAPSSKI